MSVTLPESKLEAGPRSDSRIQKCRNPPLHKLSWIVKKFSCTLSKSPVKRGFDQFRIFPLYTWGETEEVKSKPHPFFQHTFYSPLFQGTIVPAIRCRQGCDSIVTVVISEVETYEKNHASLIPAFLWMIRVDLEKVVNKRIIKKLGWVKRGTFTRPLSPPRLDFWTLTDSKNTHQMHQMRVDLTRRRRWRRRREEEEKEEFIHNLSC